MLWAVSMIFGLTSRRLPSTSRATNGKAAMTSGTMDATVPTAVPTISRVSGNHHNHQNQERDRTQQVDDDIQQHAARHRGSGRMPSFVAHHQQYAEGQADDDGKEQWTEPSHRRSPKWPGGNSVLQDRRSAVLQWLPEKKIHRTSLSTSSTSNIRDASQVCDRRASLRRRRRGCPSSILP